MVWFDTAPVQPDEAIKHLGEVLEARGMPFHEVVLKEARGGLRGYTASTPVGRVGVAVDRKGWSVFVSPPGTQRFISMWDWEEWVLGKPRPKNSELSTEDSVDWVLHLLDQGEPLGLDLGRIEEAGEELDRRVARERWLGPLMTVVSYLAVFGLLVGSVIFHSTSGMVIGTLALVRILAMKVEKVKGRFSRRMK